MPSARAYRILLVLAPRRLRHRHARDMEALFAERLAAARRRGRFSAAAAWALALADLLAARVREPFRQRYTPPVVARSRKAVMLSTDLRYACRWLLRQKFSTALVAAMLALGIAANVVAFSLLNGLFLRPFPFYEPERLVYINTTAPRWNLEIVGINYPDFVQFVRTQTQQGVRGTDGPPNFGPVKM